VPVVAAPPPPPPPPAPELARSYIVFFDWNSSSVTTEAATIIGEAAKAAKQLAVTRVELTGHADRSGTPAYNQKLSESRGAAVKNALVQLGIPADEISVVGKGEASPLVPTADGVREPQNRRVEIVLP
jgi:outer membrane protein OmpA-like peptidoglycan-associated protein